MEAGHGAREAVCGVGLVRDNKAQSGLGAWCSVEERRPGLLMHLETGKGGVNIPGVTVCHAL